MSALARHASGCPQGHRSASALPRVNLGFGVAGWQALSCRPWAVHHQHESVFESAWQLEGCVCCHMLRTPQCGGFGDLPRGLSCAPGQELLAVYFERKGTCQGWDDKASRAPAFLCNACLEDKLSRHATFEVRHQRTGRGGGGCVLIEEPNSAHRRPSAEPARACVELFAGGMG